MWLFHKYPKTCTDSAQGYFLADLELVNFLRWVPWMAGSLDKIRETAERALTNADNDSDESKSEDTDYVITENGMVMELKKNRLIFFHMLHARMIDNYLTYITSVLEEAFKQKPEILRSSEKIEYAEVLGFDEIADLRAHLAEKKVRELSYKSVDDLYDYFEDRLNLKLVPDEKKDDLIKAVATRNIIVHNRGIKNKVYCENVREPFENTGRVRDIGIQYFERTNLMLFESVKRVDSSLRRKIKLRGKRVNIEREFNEKRA